LKLKPLTCSSSPTWSSSRSETMRMRALVVLFIGVEQAECTTPGRSASRDDGEEDGKESDVVDFLALRSRSQSDNHFSANINYIKDNCPSTTWMAHDQPTHGKLLVVNTANSKWAGQCKKENKGSTWTIVKVLGVVVADDGEIYGNGHDTYPDCSSPIVHGDYVGLLNADLPFYFGVDKLKGKKKQHSGTQVGYEYPETRTDRLGALWSISCFGCTTCADCDNVQLAWVPRQDIQESPTILHCAPVKAEVKTVSTQKWTVTPTRPLPTPSPTPSPTCPGTCCSSCKPPGGCLSGQLCIHSYFDCTGAMDGKCQ